MNQDLLSKQISNGKIREKEEKNEQIKEQQRIRNEENMEKSQEIQRNLKAEYTEIQQDEIKKAIVRSNDMANEVFTKQIEILSKIDKSDMN